MSGPRRRPPRRILIVKLSAIGDVLHALPVACALREHFPGARIGWLAGQRAGAVLAGHEAIDELFLLRRHWLRSPAAVWAITRRLRRFGPDVTLDLQGLTKSALPAWLSGAGRRIGFGGDFFLDIGRWFNNDLYQRTIGRETSRWLNNELVTVTAEHIVDRYLQLLRPLGIESPAVAFNVPERPADGEAVDRFLAERSLTGGYGVINPGAGRPAKLWSMPRYAEVARHLGRTHDLPTVVVWEDAAERHMAEQIVAGASGTALPAPPTTLGELAALARRARVFVASDTGPLHLAAAVGAPCVGLFGLMPAWRNGPYGPGHVAIQKVQVSGSSLRRHRAGNDAMLAIDAAAVCAACDRILGGSPGGGAVKSPSPPGRGR